MECWSLCCCVLLVLLDTDEDIPIHTILISGFCWLFDNGYWRCFFFLLFLCGFFVAWQIPFLCGRVRIVFRLPELLGRCTADCHRFALLQLLAHRLLLTPPHTLFWIALFFFCFAFLFCFLVLNKAFYVLWLFFLEMHFCWSY